MYQTSLIRQYDVPDTLVTSLPAALVTVALGLFLLSFLPRVTASLATRRLFLLGVVDLDFPNLSLGKC